MKLFSSLRVLPLLMLAACLAGTCRGVEAQTNSPLIEIDNAAQVATDDLGRTLPDYATVGATKPNRWVGLFYWQWHASINPRFLPNAQYDMTEYLKTRPYFNSFTANPPGGPNNPTFYWGEPIFGYYRSADPWVVRKQLVMLADAGVDFLFLDYTNAQVYNTELQALLTVARELKNAGVAIPRFTFFLNYEPDWKVYELYTKWYKPGLYDDLWFKWQGKPLMMSPYLQDGSELHSDQDAALVPEIQSYFTWRETWAYTRADANRRIWRFVHGYNPPVAVDASGNPEQVVVAKSTGGPIGNALAEGGVSAVQGVTHGAGDYDPQWRLPDRDQGIFFQKHWDNAISKAPPITLVTGWNEWSASVFNQTGVIMLGQTTVDGQGHLVDEFNSQFNRDLEPVKGGERDTYYMQFLSNMRRYKGMKAPAAPDAARTIAIDGAFTDWQSVVSEFKDTPQDTASRNFAALVPSITYTNTSARNDIVASKAVADKTNVYFYARTRSALTASTGANWMLLFIDADQNSGTGWNGYDFVVNKSGVTGTTTTIARNVGGQYQWGTPRTIPLRTAGSELELAIPRNLLDAPQASPRFDFKWADNIPTAPDIMDFYSQGDVAPNTRFNYRASLLAPAGGPHVWTGAIDANWNNAGNWTNGLPVAGDDLIFSNPTAANLSNTNNFPTGMVFNSITLSAPGYTLSGNAVSLTAGLAGGNTTGSSTIVLNLAGAGTLDKSGAGTLILSGANAYLGATTVSGGVLQVNAVDALAPASEVVVNAANSSCLLFKVSGSFPNSLFLTGRGNTSSFDPANGTSGALRFNKDTGTLTLSGPIVLSGDETVITTYSAGSTVNLQGAVTGAGDFYLQAGGASATHLHNYVLSTAGAYSGNTIVQNNAATQMVRLTGGTNRLPVAWNLSFKANSSGNTGPATVDLNGSSQQIAGLLAEAGLSGAIGTNRVVNNSTTAATLNVNTATDSAYSGNLGSDTTGNNFGLTKSGTAKLTLVGGTHTYTGPTIISGGILRLAAPASTATVPVSITNPGFETPVIAAGGSGFQSAPTGAGWSFNSAGVNRNGGPFYNPAAPEGVQGGFIQSNGSISQTFTLSQAGLYKLSFSAVGRTTLGPNDIKAGIDGTPVVTTPTTLSTSAWTPFSGSIQLAAGTHTLQFQGLNTLGGDKSSAIDAVSLTMATGGFAGQTGNLPTNTLVNLSTAGATLDLNGATQSIGSLTGIAGTSVQNGALTAGGDNSTQTFGGVISGSGSFIKQGSGTQTLSGANTFTGSTSINAGILVVGNGVGGSTVSATSINNGARLHGVGSIGDGTTGVVINSGGVHKPGNSPGQQTVNGSYNLKTGGALLIEAAGPNPGSGYSQVNANGPVTLGGGLGINLQFAPTTLATNPANPTRLVVLNNNSAGAISGTFQNAPGGTLTASFGNTAYTFNVFYNRDAATPGVAASGNDVVLEAASTATTTAVNLISFGAKQFSDGLWVEWRTGLETDNLGFWLYRQDKLTKESGKMAWSKPYRLNAALIAGAALQNNRNADPSGGFRYGWIDTRPLPKSRQVRYWLQDVDNIGKVTQHGPVRPVPSQGNLGTRKSSPMVTQLNGLK